jgi:hypothetical protein
MATILKNVILSMFYQVPLLTVLVQSVIRRIRNSLCPTRKNSWQDKWV